MDAEFPTEPLRSVSRGLGVEQKDDASFGGWPFARSRCIVYGGGVNMILATNVIVAFTPH